MNKLNKKLFESLDRLNSYTLNEEDSAEGKAQARLAKARENGNDGEIVYSNDDFALICIRLKNNDVPFYDIEADSRFRKKFGIDICVEDDDGRATGISVNWGSHGATDPDDAYNYGQALVKAGGFAKEAEKYLK